MSVRLSPSGGVYYYRFMFNGKDYNGVCHACHTVKQAEKYESTIFAAVARLAQQENLSDLFRNCRDLIIEKNPIPVKGAFCLAMAKPRKRIAGAKRSAFKGNYWGIFEDYLSHAFPEIKNLQEITLSVAESFISHIRKNLQRSPATLNEIHSTVSQVFSLLKNDLSMENPFKSIEKLSASADGHEPYTLEEMKKILDESDDFLKPLFVVGFFTGLRLGDICTLKTSEIDFDTLFIRRVQRKTGVLANIPIAPYLARFLCGAVASSSSYAFPALAEQYLVCESTICNKVKNFLEGLGIKTVKNMENRRNVNVKGIHSLRHTFCSIAGIVGIPLSVVQSIVGHMTPKMTEYYSRHIDEETKKKYMLHFGNSVLPSLSSANSMPSLSDCGSVRECVMLAVSRMDEKELAELAEFLRSRKMIGMAHENTSI